MKVLESKTSAIRYVEARNSLSSLNLDIISISTYDIKEP